MFKWYYKQFKSNKYLRFLYASNKTGSDINITRNYRCMWDEWEEGNKNEVETNIILLYESRNFLFGFRARISRRILN